MKRFENAQVGDLVYCRQNGPGQIGEIKHGKDFPIKAYFKDCEETYKYCGRINFGDSEPLLFYRKGEERYLTERTEPEIDWASVSPGAVCLVTNNSNESYVERVFLCFVDGEKWFKAPCSDHASIWNYARIK